MAKSRVMNESIEARRQGQDWRSVSSSYMRGYCLNVEDFHYSLGKIVEGETVRIQWQEFRRITDNPHTHSISG